MACKLASCPTPGDKSMGRQDLLASMTMDQDFPQKVTHGRHFFFSTTQWRGEEDDTITDKVAKGKGKTRGKNKKKYNTC